MPDDVIPPRRVFVRPCTIHTGRFRWDILEGAKPIHSSPDSFLTEEDATADGERELEKLRSGGYSRRRK
jgi:hypothetical protein